jgi:ABC-2 type transport system ATP-binding protein
MALLDIDQVAISFGGLQALDDVTLDVEMGHVTGLIGPNGAGKTTLLLILASLLRPDRGEVRVAGIDPVADPYGARGRLGWMPDTFGMYDQLTVDEYLQFFADAYRMPRDASLARIGHLLNLIHLAEYATQPVHVLSRGQKQRLALARALVHQPKVLLLDEPASGLDPRSRVELRDIVRGLAEAGTAILISSHILSELEEMADRVVFVSRGRTVSEHTMTDLAAQAQIRYRVRATDPAALAAALASGGVTATAVNGHTELAAMSESDAADVLTALVGAGVRVVAFEPLGSNLESLYLSMTEERR